MCDSMTYYNGILGLFTADASVELARRSYPSRDHVERCMTKLIKTGELIDSHYDEIEKQVRHMAATYHRFHPENTDMEKPIGFFYIDNDLWRVVTVRLFECLGSDSPVIVDLLHGIVSHFPDTVTRIDQLIAEHTAEVPIDGCHRAKLDDFIELCKAVVDNVVLHNTIGALLAPSFTNICDEMHTMYQEQTLVCLECPKPCAHGFDERIKALDTRIKELTEGLEAKSSEE